jgi:hypothetical protein
MDSEVDVISRLLLITHAEPARSDSTAQLGRVLGDAPYLASAVVRRGSSRGRLCVSITRGALHVFGTDYIYILV